MRYDMVKGYSGYYNGMYNDYANVEYSVGEYWDGQYDAVKAWIDATGKKSAAFDFPCKYCINEAFHSNDMTKLVWKANGTTDQPAGMIHFGYQQYAVTFIDNHDTYRDGSKFNGNVVAANAFILMSPGTPCVFLPHYQAHKEAIQQLINIRNSAGIHNQSPVTVLRSSSDCYMAEVTGTKGKVVVKIGPAMASPSGYSDSDIKAAGTDYCVWTKVNVSGGQGGGGGQGDDNRPAALYVIGETAGHQWAYDKGEKMTSTEEGFKHRIEITGGTGTAADGYFSFVKTLSDSWPNLNAWGNRVAPTEDTKLEVNGASGSFYELENGDYAKAFYAPKGTYDLIVNWPEKKARLVSVVGVDEIGDDAEPSYAVEYFTLDGRKVQGELVPGLYIERKGATTRKIMVK